MPALTSDTIDRMMLEDPWLGTLNGRLLTLVILSGQSLGELRHIEQAELDLADPSHNKSPALHCFLGEAYHSLPEEPSYEFKLAIEKAKLARAGTEYLLDFGQRPVAEIKASLPHRGNDWGENIQAASDYARSHTIHTYIDSKKAARVYSHLNDAVRLSERNPAVFRHIVEPTIVAYLLPKAVGLAASPLLLPSELLGGSGLLLDELVTSFKAAQKRFSTEALR